MLFKVYKNVLSLLLRRRTNVRNVSKYSLFYGVEFTFLLLNCFFRNTDTAQTSLLLVSFLFYKNVFCRPKALFCLILTTEPLEIVAPPQNRTVEEGSNCTMFCNANSSLPVKIVWEKAGKEGNFLSYGSVFSMTNVSRSDTGIYRCIAKNGIALPATATALLNVLCKWVYKDLEEYKMIITFINYILSTLFS